MKLIIDINDKDYAFIQELAHISIGRGNCKIVQQNVINAIKFGTPYEDKIEQITDLLETEWGYEGIREDVSRILRGGRK